jgi:signal transduction histidine kinase
VQTIAILRQDRRVATLIVAFPSGSVSDRLPLRLIWPGLLGFLILVTAGVGGYWLLTRALRPVRLVTQTAREISLSDLSRRLNVSSSDELGELAATFDQMLGRLDEAFARQRRFTADASHELRAPLSVIQLEAARMLDQPSTHQECLDALAEIRRTSAGMALLVEDLLLLARSDEIPVRREASEFDLSDQVYDVADRLVPMAHQRHLQLLLGNLPEVPVRGDRQAIARMIGNVIENAIKYAAGFGHWVRIETGQRLEEGKLWGWIEVADDGPGIPADHLPQIFDRFYRVDQARTPGTADDDAVPAPAGAPVRGSGLGLAIAQSVAVAHGGEIQIHSPPGQGCQVTIVLPLVRQMSSAAPPSIRHARASHDTPASTSDGRDVQSAASHAVAPRESG